MKKIISSIILLLAFLPVFAVKEAEKCAYIYFKDGGARVFFLSEIKSISHSDIDLDGEQQPEIISQEIETADGIYRYLLEDIDRIEFEAPATVYQDDVVNVSEDWIDYIKSIDDLTITLDGSVNPDILPQKGDVIYSPECLDRFGVVFAGRVMEIESGNELKIKCEEVDVKDIFRRYIQKENIDMTDELYSGFNTSSRDLEQETRADEPLKMKYGLNSDGEYYIDFGIMGIYFRPELRSSTQTVITEESEYMSSRNFLDVYGRIEYSLEKSGNWAPDPTNIMSKAIPIVRQAGIFLILNLGAYIELEGKIQANMNIPFEVHGIFGFTREDGEIIDRENTWDSSLGDFSADLQLSGEIEAGLSFETTLAWLHERVMSVGIEGKVGPSLKGDIYLFDTNWDFYTYNALKDSKIELDIDADIHAVWFFFNNHATIRDFNPQFSRRINEWYLVPEFSNLKVLPSSEATTLNLHADINRNLLLPANLSWRLYDKDMNFYREEVHGETYRLPDQWAYNGFERSFTDLPRGKTFTAVPNVTVHGIKADADVSVPCKIGALPVTGNAMVSQNKVALNGSIQGEDLSEITAKGFYYSTSPNPADGIFQNAVIQPDNSMTVEINGLEYETTYYYCAYMEENGEKLYGETKSFKTEAKAVYDDWLKIFYESTNGDNWTHNDNWLSGAPIEDWYGFERRYNENIFLDLSSNNLTGEGRIINPKDVRGFNFRDNNLKSLYFENCFGFALSHETDGYFAQNNIIITGLKLELLHFNNFSDSESSIIGSPKGSDNEDITEIKSIKFENCNNMESINFNNIISDNIVFENCNNMGKVYVNTITCNNILFKNCDFKEDGFISTYIDKINCNVNTVTLYNCVVPGKIGSRFNGTLILENCDIGSHIFGEGSYFIIKNSYIEGKLINFSGSEEEFEDVFHGRKK